MNYDYDDDCLGRDCHLTAADFAQDKRIQERVDAEKLQSPLEKQLHALERKYGLGLTESLWILSHWNHSGLETEVPEFTWAQEENE